MATTTTYCAFLAFQPGKLHRSAIGVAEQRRCSKQQLVGLPARATSKTGRAEEDNETGQSSVAALLSKDPSAAPEAAASALLEGVFDAAPPPPPDTSLVASHISSELAAIYATCKDWIWHGYRIVYSVQGIGPPLLLVHGFGASIGHWRRNITVLSKNHTVFAIDLIGLGSSEKPPMFKYTMETWAEMLIDFIKDVISAPTVLIGNSIGSLACTIVAAEAPKDLVRGMVLLNCSGGMNNKAVVDDWHIRLFLPLLWMVDFLLLQKSIAGRLFQRVQTRENLRNVLQAVYCNKEAVDDELIEIIARPAQDPGALDAFVAIITGPPGPTPMSLFPKISVPVLVLWGDKDPFTPIDGPVGKFFSGLPETESNVQLHILENVGHCPHDDRPDLVHQELLPWLAHVCGVS
ncbi:hypothetical protein GOP47_0007341 [Adiantum capillus-veneris]|uniref:AB hydrolase-1 domain-containing protein n=1 Tax=Adiantum capillus-veneris TaxID=13818 RepID=A0A9D4V1Y6_ADICA|nr:hypothetical protein GOP47_0007341 [Adiantum capillus-veneris]